MTSIFKTQFRILGLFFILLVVSCRTINENDDSGLKVTVTVDGVSKTHDFSFLSTYGITSRTSLDEGLPIESIDCVDPYSLVTLDISCRPTAETNKRYSTVGKDLSDYTSGWTNINHIQMRLVAYSDVLIPNNFSNPGFWYFIPKSGYFQITNRNGNKISFNSESSYSDDDELGVSHNVNVKIIGTNITLD